MLSLNWYAMCFMVYLQWKRGLCAWTRLHFKWWISLIIDNKAKISRLVYAELPLLIFLQNVAQESWHEGRCLDHNTQRLLALGGYDGGFIYWVFIICLIFFSSDLINWKNIVKLSLWKYCFLHEEIKYLFLVQINPSYPYLAMIW